MADMSITPSPNLLERVVGNLPLVVRHVGSHALGTANQSPTHFVWRSPFGVAEKDL